VKIVKVKKRGPGRPRTGPSGTSTLRVQDIPLTYREQFSEFCLEHGVTARYVILKLMEKCPSNPEIAAILLGAERKGDRHA
jgi:hypothetical protein